jgi:hypothetical protein
MDICPSALRAALRSARPDGHFPLVLTACTGKRSVYHLNHSSLDSQRPSVDKDIRDLVAGRLDDVSEGLAGNPHFLRGGGLVHPFQVRETEGFEFITRQADLLETGQWDSRRLEILAPRTAVNPAADQWPGHRAIHRLFIGIC